MKSIHNFLSLFITVHGALNPQKAVPFLLNGGGKRRAETEWIPGKLSYHGGPRAAAWS